MCIHLDRPQSNGRCHSGTMSLNSVMKTKRCSGFGERVADTIAKGEIQLVRNMGLTSPTWLRSSQVLMDWVKKPVVTPSLGHQLHIEISNHIEVVLPASCRSNFDDVV